MSEKKTSKAPPAKAKAPSPKEAKPAAAKGASAAAPKAPESKRHAKPAATSGSARAKAAAPPPAPTEARKEHNFRRKMIGTVVSDKMDKTIVVEVIRRAMHPVYEKYVRVSNKYKAHDELNQYKTGDRVEIMEHRPLSKEKRWTVVRLLSRPVEA